ncbi:rhodanese-like domain-containing protein [Micromonospora globbae]|uniref:rhodanese-like domain-containing protein n=1 Tax=Micromonospora globbae TaxID=1894969 RepID=UPI0037879336
MQTSASEEPANRSPARLWPIAILVVALAGLVAGYLAVGSPGMDDRVERTAIAQQEPVARLGVEEFAARMANRDSVVINVHTPYEGELEGTDLFIAFDRIADDPRLPADRTTKIFLYCRSGSMSDQARRTLQSKGYQNVADLDGGMRAWESAGRATVNR